MKHALSEASLPRGFRFAATACGLKKTGALDLAILSSDVPASAAAVFTQNLVAAAPVLISKQHLRASKGHMRAAVVNAGNANCATGVAGHAAAQRTVAEAAKRLGCPTQEVFVCSTGVIGVPLPVEKILRALPTIARHRRPSARSFAELSLAICTTDTRPKTAAASFKMAGKRIHLVGCAKGAGMIHPNMATMLAFVATDAAIAPSPSPTICSASEWHTSSSAAVNARCALPPARIAGASAAPFARTSKVSFVEVSPSTLMALNVCEFTSCSVFCSREGAIAASVATNASIVAIFGWIMPAPLAHPTK